MGLGITGEHDFAGVLDHTLVQWSPFRPPHQSRHATPRQRVFRGGAAFGVVGNGATGAGELARQVEPVTDVQGGADLVRELGQQLIASAARHPVQLGAHIEKRQIGVIQ